MYMILAWKVQVYYILLLDGVRICGPRTQDVFNTISEKNSFKNQLENQGLSYDGGERRERMWGKNKWRKI